MAPPPWTLSATALAARFAAGDLTPTEALEAVLARLDAVNPRLNAVIATDHAAARAAASASTARYAAGTPRSQLDGVPFTVKDNIPAAGLPTYWGSAAFHPLAPIGDELPIARLRAAGCVVIGKTNVPEFTLQGYTDNAVFGPTRNPWNTNLTPGGSSGGAVAAVAAGIAPFAIGTDGGGSIRRPASHAGVIGLKPSLGRVARRDGLPAILLDYEVIGPIARRVADLVAIMTIIAQPDAGDPASLGHAPFTVPPARTCRILYVPRFDTNPVDPEIAASTDATARALEALGHTIETGPAPFDVAAVARIQATVSQAGLAWLIAETGIAPAAPSLRETAALGAALPASPLFGALDAATMLRRSLALAFTRHDLIPHPGGRRTPLASGANPPRHHRRRSCRPARPRRVHRLRQHRWPPRHHPARPARRQRLPIGAQLVGPSGAEGLLLAIAAALEAAHDWGADWPPLDG